MLHKAATADRADDYRVTYDKQRAMINIISTEYSGQRRKRKSHSHRLGRWCKSIRRRNYTTAVTQDIGGFIIKTSAFLRFLCGKDNDQKTMATPVHLSVAQHNVSLRPPGRLIIHYSLRRSRVAGVIGGRAGSGYVILFMSWKITYIANKIELH